MRGISAIQRAGTSDILHTAPSALQNTVVRGIQPTAWSPVQRANAITIQSACLHAIQRAKMNTKQPAYSIAIPPTSFVFLENKKAVAEHFLVRPQPLAFLR